MIWIVLGIVALFGGADIVLFCQSLAVAHDMCDSERP